MRGTILRAALAALLCAVAVVAQTGDEKFVGEYWQRFVAGRKIDPEQHPQHLGALTAWNTEDSLYLLPFDFVCPTSLCSECQSGRFAPHAFRLPFRTGTTVPFALVREQGASVYQPTQVKARVVFALPDGRLYGLTATWNGAYPASAAWVEGSLGGVPNGGKIPQVVAPAQDFSPKTDSAALVFGSAGLGRRVEWTQKDGFTWTDLGLPIADYCARGGRYLGTGNGTIYRFDGFPNLTEVSPTFNSAVMAMDSTAALLRDHSLLYYEDSQWRKAAQKAELTARAWVLDWDGQGLRAKVWSDAAQPAILRLSDDPTRLYRLVSFDELFPLDSDVVSVYPDGGIVTLFAQDADQDFDPLIVRRIRGKDTLVLSGDFRKTVPGWGPVLGNARGPGCAADGICLGGSPAEMFLALRSDSAILTLPVLKGIMDKMCPNQPYFSTTVDTAYTLRMDFRMRDEVQVGIGRDVYRVSYASTGILVRRPLSPASMGAGTLRRVDGRAAGAAAALGKENRRPERLFRR